MGTLRNLPRELEATRPLIGSLFSSNRSSVSASVTTFENGTTLTKRFEDIPGPRGVYSIPLIGSSLLFSKYSFPKANLVFKELHEKYGKIVRVRTGLSWSVFLFDPVYIQHAISNAGKYPVRMVSPLMKTYSERNGNKPMISIEQGERWHKLRSVIQHKLKPSAITQYLPIQCSCADDLIRWLTINSDSDVKLDAVIKRYVADATVAIGFNAKVGFLKDMGKNQENEEFLKSTGEMIEMIGKSFYSFPFYKFFKTATYRKYETASNIVYRFGRKMVNEATYRLNDSSSYDNETNLLKSMTEDTSMSRTLVVDVTTGFTFAGIVTTTQPVMWILWLLGLHDDKQQKLYEEICTKLPNGDITPQNLGHLPYLKAFVKESFRYIFPSLNGSMRLMPEDIVIDNFHIPKGTNVHFGHNALCGSKEYFEKPDEFIPERWLPGANDPEKQRLMSMCVQPFGLGKRNCPGRRVAEQLIYVTLIKILQNFKLTIPSGSTNIGISYYTQAVPDKPIKINFTKQLT